MSGIGVILNPRSGRNLRDPGAASRLARMLGDHGILRQAREAGCAANTAVPPPRIRPATATAKPVESKAARIEDAVGQARLCRY